MSRSVPWRRTCPDKVSSRIDRATRARIYLLRATGPTGFLLTAEGDDRKYKVFLGDPHTCTCAIFVKEKDLCVHILWVLIKKFRVPKENSEVFQLGLVEREIGEVVRGLFANTGGNKPSTNKTDDGQSDSREKLSKKEIMEDDICPICQEDLFGEKQPTTYCKYGCGNSVHVKCMKIWAEHQKSSGETTIKCPLCRVDFGPFETIKTDYLRSIKNKQRYDVHVGAVCAHCRASPIMGRCYRCTMCINYQLCKDCFSLDPHPQHSFHFRQKANQRWRPATKFQAIPSAVVNDLERREIAEQDYNLLLQLDGSSVNTCSVPGHVLNSFPTERLEDDHHRLIMNPTEKCGVCLCSYRSSEVVRRLPCNHEFHRVCIDSWLSREHNVCPIDGQTIYSELTSANTPANGGINRSFSNHRQPNHPSKRTSIRTLTKLQRTQSNSQEPTIPQDFSLYGLSLRQRADSRRSSKVTVPPDRTNSAPCSSPLISLPHNSSSGHIVFDTTLPGRPVVSAEQVMKYGRHSGDSRLRALRLSRNKNKKIGHKSISLNDITLSGQKISTTEFKQAGQTNGEGQNLVPCSATDHNPTVLHTTILSSSPDPNQPHVRIDV